MRSRPVLFIRHWFIPASLWDERDQFYYDSVEEDGVTSVLRIRSLVGLTSLFSAFVLNGSRLSKLTRFTRELRAYHLRDRTGSVRAADGNLSFMKFIFYVSGDQKICNNDIRLAGH